jgi:hypothetical protein
MSNQQEQEDSQPESQQHTYLGELSLATSDYYRTRSGTPYDVPSGEDWVDDLLRDPQRVRNELGVSRGTFTILCKAIQSLDINLSRHVPIQEQLAIFLYTVVTGLRCAHVAERFRRSQRTITK